MNKPTPIKIPTKTEAPTKTWAVTVNGKSVQLVSERKNISTQILTAKFGDYSEQRTVVHDPSNFKAADAQKELDRMATELAQRVMGMADVDGFLSGFHGDQK
jgi:hypothetical protein